MGMVAPVIGVCMGVVEKGWREWGSGLVHTVYDFSLHLKMSHISFHIYGPWFVQV